MPKYRCNVCHALEYDIERGDATAGIAPGTRPQDLPEGWRCQVCGSDRSHLQPVEAPVQELQTEEQMEGYLARWRRKTDETETHMAEIHSMSTSARTIIEPMRTKAPVISWDDILFLGAQLAKIPLDGGDPVCTNTVIGPKAKRPLVIDTPIFVSHMSFGSLSKECKIALARGSAAVGSAVGSGEGGMLEEEFQNAHRYIFEYVPNKYCVTEENLRKVHAIEIKFGQSVKPGMGGLLPAEKVTREIATLRGKPEGADIISPASFPEIRDRAGLRKTVGMLKDVSGGRPVGIKLAAGHIEDDLAVALYAEPDFVTIDGRPGSTGATPKFVKDSSSVPTVLALHRARKFLDSESAEDVTLVITGGLRVSSDFVKALAMGADAVAIGTAALMAVGCQQYRICNTGHCPVGIATQDPNLRARLNVDLSAKRLENFLRASTEELKDFARMSGNDDVHELDIEDLCTVSSEISGHTDIRHA